MSRVFLARELELDRQVVVKVLPPDLAAGLNADRFRREILLAAKLQHPHIVPVLSAAAKGGLLYFTMPFISGENLRARLVRLRELPVADATRIVREVADALEYAHGEGVVHRDIKPENILFSGSHALVTDFGVSKALSNATAETRVDGSPNLTSLGIALGTPAYMAPEQAAADPNVDHRADIYSLGVVGYEMLAGRPPFSGMTPQQVLSAQVTINPDPVTNHRPNLPPALAAAVMRCLEKHPSDRWQTAGELRTQLETVFTPSGVTQPVAPMRAPFRWTPQRVMIVAAAAGVVVAAFALSSVAFKNDDAGITIGATHQVTSLPGVELYPAISPDGKMVAYVSASATGKAQIFLRQVSGGRAVPLTDGLSDAVVPKWKPDGSSLIYSGADGTLYTMPPLGGSPTALIGKSVLSGPFVDCDWSPSGAEMACSSLGDGTLYVLGANGENPRRVTKPGHDIAHSVAWSPDGKRLAYVVGNAEFVSWGGTLGNIAASSIWVVPASGGDPTRVSDSTHLNMSPIWRPDSEHILFVSSIGGPRDIYSQRLRSNGQPRDAAVRLTTGLNPHSISLSADGRYLGYSAFTTAANIWSAPVNGAAPVSTSMFKQVTFGNQTIESFARSKNGQWLAYDSNVNGNVDVYKMSLAGGEPQQLTRDPADDFFDSWSPDGTEILIHSFRGGTRDIFVMSADGSNVRPLVATARQERGAQWSADGNSISYAVLPDSIFIIKRAGSGWGPPQFFRLGVSSSWSPDGKFVAVAGTPGMTLISTVGGAARLIAAPSALRGTGGAAWSFDSRFIYSFGVRPDGTSMLGALDVATGSFTPVMHLTDPLRQIYRGFISTDSSRVFFILGTRESDVWVMELNRK